jgi:hypothetical protein
MTHRHWMNYWRRISKKVSVPRLFLVVNDGDDWRCYCSCCGCVLGFCRRPRLKFSVLFFPLKNEQRADVYVLFSFTTVVNSG